MRDVIHFAHGNGFPSQSYKQLLDALSVHFDCVYIDKIGHHQDFPVTQNWDFLTKELIQNVETQSSQPVIGLGHSLGGVLSLLAAIQQPHLFKAVILLDSPFMNPFKSLVLYLLKSIGLIDRITPARQTRYRRQHWKTRSQVLEYLQQRKLFSHFTLACLNDYIDFGLQKDDAGYSLRFDSEIEYQIFRTIPDNLYQHRGKLKTPTALIYGTKSTVIDRFDLRYMRNKYHITCYSIDGTHMFPMECPELTASKIMEAINGLLLYKE